MDCSDLVCPMTEMFSAFRFFISGVLFTLIGTNVSLLKYSALRRCCFYRMSAACIDKKLSFVSSNFPDKNCQIDEEGGRGRRRKRSKRKREYELSGISHGGQGAGNCVWATFWFTAAMHGFKMMNNPTHHKVREIQSWQTTKNNSVIF